MLLEMKREGKEWEPHKEKQLRREGQRGLSHPGGAPLWAEPAWLAPSTGPARAQQHKQPMMI